MLKLCLIGLLFVAESLACDMVIPNVGKHTEFDTNYYAEYFSETGEFSVQMPIIVLNKETRNTLESFVGKNKKVCLLGTRFDRLFYAYSAEGAPERSEVTYPSFILN